MKLGSRRERLVNAVIVVVALLATPAAFLFAGWVIINAVFGESLPDCDDYSFDAEAWADKEGDGREDEAAALAECGTLGWDV